MDNSFSKYYILAILRNTSIDAAVLLCVGSLQVFLGSQHKTTTNERKQNENREEKNSKHFQCFHVNLRH